MKLCSQHPQPLDKNFRLIYLALEVHQVPIKPKLFAYFSEFPSVEPISINNLLGERLFLIFQIRMIQYFSIKKKLRLDSSGLPFENQSAQNLDSMLMCNVYEPRWRDCHCVMAEVDKNVDIGPMIKSIPHRLGAFDTIG